MFPLRLRSLEVVFVALVLLLLVRLFYVQFVRGDEFRALANLEDGRRVELPALRGRIFDRDGFVLARDRCAYAVHVTPSLFRRRSAIHALRDALILIGDEGRARGGALALLEDVLDYPEACVARLLDLPANAVQVDDDVLSFRAKRLQTYGWPLIEWELGGLAPRLRECLGVLRSETGSLSRSNLRAFAEAEPGRTLGEALGLSVLDVAGHVRGEVALLDRLSGEVGAEGTARILTRLESLLEKERDWVDEHVAKEVREAVCLNHLGTARIEPESLGPRAYLELARELACPVTDPALAEQWLISTSSLLSGGLPELPREVGTETVIDVREPLPDAVAVAAEAGLVALDPDRLAEAYTASIFKKEEVGPDDYLTAYRRRKVYRRLVGGRSFLVGRGAEPWIADAVEGPGRLQELGFEVHPHFVRSEIIGPAAPSARLLVGVVNSRGVAVSGIERRLDDVLRGDSGEAIFGADGRVLSKIEPRHGTDVSLTLSFALQQRLEGVLTERGAIAVLDARDGAVLALLTYPAAPEEEVEDRVALRMELERKRLELQRIVNRGGPAAEQARAPLAATWADLVECDAYLRAVDSPRYTPPGSTFKAVTVLAGLDAGVIDETSTHVCEGAGRNNRYGCAHRHDIVDAKATLERSCNRFCYDTALRLTAPRLVSYVVDRLGYGEALPGLLPRDVRQLRDLRAETDARSLAIGQASFNCPPVRAAGIFASIATGRRVLPHLYRPEGFVPVGDPIASDAALAVVREGLSRVVFGARGTARTLPRLREFDVVGKTGTADHKQLPGSIHQAWFAGYAPRQAPRIAFAVMLDYTEKKGGEAARVAEELVTRCFEVLGR